MQLDPDVHILNSGKPDEIRVKKCYQIVVGRKRSSQHEVMGASEYADIGNGVEGSQLVGYGVLIADPRTEAYEHRNVLFIHFKMEKLIKNHAVPYTFVRAGYFMQNLHDVLAGEIRDHRRIMVPAGKGKTSFVDTRDVAEVCALSLMETEKHRHHVYTVTSAQAFDFFEVAHFMTDILGVPISYANPSIRAIKQEIRQRGEEESIINVIVGVHVPTKLGLAKGITHDYERLTGKTPTTIQQYIEDFQVSWL